MRPGLNRIQHSWVVDCRGIALTLKLELLLIDASRDISSENEREVNGLGECGLVITEPSNVRLARMALIAGSRLEHH